MPDSHRAGGRNARRGRLFVLRSPWRLSVSIINAALNMEEGTPCYSTNVDKAVTHAPSVRSQVRLGPALRRARVVRGSAVHSRDEAANFAPSPPDRSLHGARPRLALAFGR